MTQCHRFASTLIAVALLPMDAFAGSPPSQLTLESYTFSSRGGETTEAVLGSGPPAGGASSCS